MEDSPKSVMMPTLSKTRLCSSSALAQQLNRRMPITIERSALFFKHHHLKSIVSCILLENKFSHEVGLCRNNKQKGKKMISITTFVSGIVGWIKSVGAKLLEKEFLKNATASLLFEQGLEGAYTLVKYAFTDPPVIELDLSESNRTAYKPLRQVYEAQQYAQLLNSENESDIERAKEKLRELNLPGLTDEVIEAGEEEILHMVNRLEEAYERIALLFRPIALYLQSAKPRDMHHRAALFLCFSPKLCQSIAPSVSRRAKPVMPYSKRIGRLYSTASA